MYSIEKNISHNIFRAYDIRGIVDKELSENAVFTIGLALGNTALAQQEKKFYVGRDGRLSGNVLSKALMTGIRTAGCDVIDIGMVPTPVLYFAAQVLGTGTGVMLTGSHNPASYNGLKMLIAGTTLHSDAIQALLQKILHADLTTRELGDYQLIDITSDYLHDITQRIQLSRPFKIVIDSGNGVTGQLAPQLFSLLGCEVIPLFCDIDGNFPNHHPDPMVPANLRQLIDAVKAHRADLGFAFDGDGDRLGLVTEQGDIIWPDRQLLLFAQDILKRYPGASIIYDVKCSRLLTDLIRENGGNAIMSATGHSLIKAALKKYKAPLAGEMSGHIFFNDNWYGFDDALYCGARLLQLLSQQTLTVSQVFAQFPEMMNTPEISIPIAEDKKFALIQALQKQAQFPDAEISTIDGIRADFPTGWGLIRASNTTPTLVARFEADTPEHLTQIQTQFKNLLQKLAPELPLPF